MGNFKCQSHGRKYNEILFQDFKIVLNNAKTHMCNMRYIYNNKHEMTK